MSETLETEGEQFEYDPQHCSVMYDFFARQKLEHERNKLKEELESWKKFAAEYAAHKTLCACWGTGQNDNCDCGFVVNRENL